MSEHRAPRRHYRRHLNVTGLVVLTIIVIIELLSRQHALPSAVLQAQPDLLPVVHVEDGDTITVREPDGSNKTVRLIGVDTPETVDPRKPVQCGGPEASKHTKAIMTSAKVRLAPYPDDQDTDKYGRLLRYVYLPDGTLYNQQLIEQGYGFAYTVFGFSKLDDFKATEAAAKAAGRGIWSLCQINESQAIKQTAGPKQP